MLVRCVCKFGGDDCFLSGIHVSHKKEFSNGLKWSAITCIVVSAPVIGRAAQTGAERILGTVTGGFLGFGYARLSLHNHCAHELHRQGSITHLPSS